MEMTTTTRRQFLKTVGGVTLGVVAVSGASTLLACAPKKVEAQELPWPYQKLDPVATAERAYTAYYNGGCMYGAFEGIVGELRDKVGAPYDQFPAAMMKYGGAGVAGWGTLCGALNGAAAATYLLHDSKTGNPIINEVFGWYGAEQLPNYKPASPKFANISSTAANSQLCHASVSEWCTRSGFKATSPERAERCAWLTASVAKYAVELLNQQADSSFKLVHTVPASVKECLSCHSGSGSVGNVHTSNQSTCTSCHDVAKHPIPLRK
ncbi:MAG: C-GCAxxG-C-C family protein [Chloroflexi bacterium]|nr:C-GCAxxG-C-C family protein [Chloroflexota bacterium]